VCGCYNSVKSTCSALSPVLTPLSLTTMVCLWKIFLATLSELYLAEDKPEGNHCAGCKPGEIQSTEMAGGAEHFVSWIISSWCHHGGCGVGRGYTTDIALSVQYIKSYTGLNLTDSCGVPTERRGWLVNTQSSYSGSPGFDSRPRRLAIQN
jgi:hypothetical protein